MIDETKRVLAEGVVKTADEADFALLLGAGLPRLARRPDALCQEHRRLGPACKFGLSF
jgi:hypothetical protein